MKYNILVSFDTNKVIKSIGNIVDEVNHCMEGFGFSEKMILRSNAVPMAVLEIGIELSAEDLAKIADVYAKNFAKAFPDSNPEVEVVPEVDISSLLNSII